MQSPAPSSLRCRAFRVQHALEGSEAALTRRRRRRRREKKKNREKHLPVSHDRVQPPAELLTELVAGWLDHAPDCGRWPRAAHSVLVGRPPHHTSGRGRPSEWHSPREPALRHTPDSRGTPRGSPPPEVHSLPPPQVRLSRGAFEHSPAVWWQPAALPESPPSSARRLSARCHLIPCHSSPLRLSRPYSALLDRRIDSGAPDE
mmetsp:Transcript_53417/g.134189  ORF Transcript_53417/g.134189 Transcript_53417/m.134189 type:complete len:203 (+) Transcript_53417:1525-2133(+)